MYKDYRNRILEPVICTVYIIKRYIGNLYIVVYRVLYLWYLPIILSLPLPSPSEPKGGPKGRSDGDGWERM